MAFKIKERLIADDNPFEYHLVTDSEAVTAGEALILSSGRLTLCPATTVPEFIAIADVEAGTDQICPVIRVRETDIYEVEATAAVATTLIGQKVELNTDALSVTTTTTSGVFQITHADGSTTVRGRFLK